MAGTGERNVAYDRAYTSFRWPPVGKYNFARDVIDQWAGRRPDGLALRWIDDHGRKEDVTFSMLRSRSCKLANALHNGGVRPGDVVVVILGREVAWWESLTACIRGGFVVSPGTTQLTPKEIGYRVQASSAAAIITDDLNAEKVDAVASMCSTLKIRLSTGTSRDGWMSYRDGCAAESEDFVGSCTRTSDAAICYFTSGTTGLPKMVVHSHGYTLAHQTTGRYWLDLGAGDLHWNVSDTGWAKAAWSSYFGPWHQGAAVLVHQAPTFDPKKVLEILATQPVSTLCAAPTAYRMLVRESVQAARFPSLRHCVSAGEPLNPEVIETWRRATGITIRDGYGQTESVILCGSFPSIPARPGSMGRPAPGFDLRIISEMGEELPDGQEGDLAVRVHPEHPLGLFHGYPGDPERHEACFRGPWYVTGDRAYRDSDGYFWFVGRADDVIISAGYRIGPFEVESALLEHPAVVESAVVSSPDELRGEVVKAFVVLAPGYSPSGELIEQLQRHVKHATAPYKYPRRIEFVEVLPKTVSGKIRRVELRNREWKRT